MPVLVSNCDWLHVGDVLIVADMYAGGRIMALTGHSILIIDTNADGYVGRLRTAIQDAGAESIIARTAGTARERVKRSSSQQLW